MTTTQAYEVAETHPDALAAGREAIQAILQRSATDRGFRQTLLTDPHAAIAEATGEAVPDSFQFAFVENAADATFVLPDFADPDAELSEDDLEDVAGGALGTALVLMATIFALGAAAS